MGELLIETDFSLKDKQMSVRETINYLADRSQLKELLKEKQANLSKKGAKEIFTDVINLQNGRLFATLYKDNFQFHPSSD